MSIHKYVILSIAKDLLAVKELCVRLHLCNPQCGGRECVILSEVEVSTRSPHALPVGYIFVTRKEVEWVSLLRVGAHIGHGLHFCNPQMWWLIVSLWKSQVSVGYIFVTRNVVEWVSLPRVRAHIGHGLYFCNPKGGGASVCAVVFASTSFMGYIFVTRNVVEWVSWPRVGAHIVHGSHFCNPQ